MLGSSSFRLEASSPRARRGIVHAPGVIDHAPALVVEPPAVIDNTLRVVVHRAGLIDNAPGVIVDARRFERLRLRDAESCHEEESNLEGRFSCVA
jgi:hypothetical protein